MLQLSVGVRDDIIAHARTEAPKECCGFLVGRGRRVERAIRMQNLDRSPISYTMDPLEQLRVEKQLRQAGLEVAGIYHSHTVSPAYPSPIDVRLATYPETTYVIVSLTTTPPEIKGYTIKEGQVRPDDLQWEAKPV